MKRYLLFYGYQHYPNGGMDDLQGDFNTVKDAERIIKKDVEYGMWYQIYDTETREIIKQS